MGKKKIAIIGGGPAGLFAAYKLKANDSFDITIFERGSTINNRNCPLKMGRRAVCAKCNPCAITSGLSGAGAFSDGKYIIGTEYGGWLTDFLDPSCVISYINEASAILNEFGATDEIYYPDNSLKQKFLQHDMNMLQAEVKHLGTDNNFFTMSKMIQNIESSKNVTIKTLTEVADVVKTKNNNYAVILSSDSTAGFFDYVIFAVGRSGNDFFNNWCKSKKIKTIPNQVDIGVRVELPELVWHDFTEKVYEPKIEYRTKQYGDNVRSFCVNPGGEVVIENNNNVLSVNGHSYANKDKYTANTNFALLSTVRFTEPFDQPVEYARRIVSLANAISGGSVIVQTLGDLEKGRRTNEHRLNQNRVRPTLKAAVAGDLSLCMPKRQLDNIIEMLHKLNEVMPGTSNPSTLLYGVEAKYYSARPETTNNFELTTYKNIYAIGDGAGFTRSLSHAAAQGLYVADIISAKEY